MGNVHNFIKIPTKFTCTKASALNAEHANVGVVPKKPLFVTSSTVSPIESTNVAFTKDTIIYASNSSATNNNKSNRILLLLKKKLLYYKNNF